uniref:Neur_chan_LBD domain-containing protein n=1 Tax=Globodera pallida TaxID=36090 RepID=A0A183CIC1_GLOPA
MTFLTFFFRQNIFALFATTSVVFGDRRSLYDQNGEFLPHVRLAKDLVEKYDQRVRPVMNHSIATRVNFTMSLYQILAINEKVQSVDLNLWIIQKWKDEFLGWDPHKYGGINATILPHHRIWLPDTYLYNSMVMNREESERYINVIVSTDYWNERRGAEVMFMFPALYRVSCRIHIQYFPYDQQNCTLVISSSIDYWPDSETVNLYSFIPNEEWEVMSFEIHRVVEKFVCCNEPWVLLHASLVVRRKPLYYIVNLVLPTSVITLVAVTGFFTPASTSNERREKLSLGIDSLLAMSILMMMVSEQMPTTSEYVPLFGLFYLSIIVIIFSGTLITALVLNVHLQKTYNRPIPPLITFIFFHKIAPWLGIRPSMVLMELWQETGVCIRGLNDEHQRPRSDSRRRVAKSRSTSRRRHQLQMASTDASGMMALEHMGTEQSPLERSPNYKNVKQAPERSSVGNFFFQMRRISSGGGGGSGNKWKKPPAGGGKGGGVDELLTPNLGEPAEWSVMEQSIAEEDEAEGPGVNPNSGLSAARSVIARRNWRRIAQKACAKHRDALERGQCRYGDRDALERGQCRSGDRVSEGGEVEEIPFADLSPGRLSLASPVRQLYSTHRTSSSVLSPRLPSPLPSTHPKKNAVPQQPQAASSSTLSHRPPASAAVAKAPVKKPPPVPCKKFSSAAQPNKSPVQPVQSSLSPSMPPALQLLLLPSNSKKDPNANAAAMLDLKLRRRFAHEWEFLATVLDRVLLIAFVGLVVFVTAAMMAIGELILRSYPNGVREWHSE